MKALLRYRRKLCVTGVVQLVFVALLGACGEGGARSHNNATGITISASVDVVHGNDTAAVEVAGLAPSQLDILERLTSTDGTWTSVFRVTVAADTDANISVPPVVGSYSIREHRAVFVPRFGFAEGVSYRVELDTAALGEGVDGAPRIVKFIAIPKAVREPSARIVAVHPSADVLPENLLRWYIEFSEPMERGHSLDYVHLVDEAGAKVHAAFLELDEELWDASRKRVTVLFDPGRVKRGLRQNLEMGAPLVAGRRYRLVVDGSWPDANGAPLKSGYERQFAAGAADRKSPTPGDWTLNRLEVGTRQPLRVSFDGIVDHVLGGRLAVITASGSQVAGAGSMTEHDRGWVFVPTKAWSAREYEIQVPEMLEDVAGNSLRRLFDVDQLASVSRPARKPAARLRFRPTAAGNSGPGKVATRNR